MFKKIKVYLENKQNEVKQREELKRQQMYYRLIKAGSEFTKFIQEDLKRKGNDMNRHQRRRFEKELNGDGKFSPELINYYSQKIDWVLKNIHQRLNPPKPGAVKINPNVQVSKEKPADAK